MWEEVWDIGKPNKTHQNSWSCLVPLLHRFISLWCKPFTYFEMPGLDWWRVGAIFELLDQSRRLLLLSCLLKHLLSFKKGMLGVFSVFIVMKMVCVGCEFFKPIQFWRVDEKILVLKVRGNAELKEISIMLKCR